MSNRKNTKVAPQQEEVAPQQEVVAPQPETATAILAIPSAAPASKGKGNGKHKPDSQVTRWRAQANLPETGVITIVAKTNPKSQGAATRFALYRTGMQVAEYIEAVVKHGQTKAQAKADVRWDVTAGFIAVA